MNSAINDDYIKAVIELGGLLMQFGKVSRATYLDTDRTPESDTDHTVMLAVLACAIAARFHPDYDLGKIAQYALVHDLVEVYAGDINTINFYAVNQKEKDANELAALLKIKKQFGANFPWLSETIEQYESLADPEARFIKTLDKALPAITHHHVNNIAVNEGFDNPEAFEDSINARDKHMQATFAADQPVAMQIRKAILKDVIENKYQFHGKKRPNEPKV